MATRPVESIQDFRISGRSAGALALLAFLLGYGMRGGGDEPPAPAHFAANSESGFVATLAWGTLITLGWAFRERIGAMLRDAPRSRLLLVGLAFVPVAIADVFTTQLLAALAADPGCTAPAPTLPAGGEFLPRAALLGGTMLLVLLAWERHLLGGTAPPAGPLHLPPAPPAAPGAWLDFPEAPLLRVRADDVALIRSAGNYSEIVARDRVHLVRATLSELADRLEPMGFVRVHRQTVINARGVRQICRDGAGRALVHLACGHAVPVGRRYMAAIDALTR